GRANFDLYYHLIASTVILKSLAKKEAWELSQPDPEELEEGEAVEGETVEGETVEGEAVEDETTEGDDDAEPGGAPAARPVAHPR
ncbi:MAG TPA: hypothetical protein VFU59_05810, partial [Candidatus Eisenbacteria bacterium]|nr:hypothetical protein [Candidatus Eisenbacteria bacterium]